MCDHDRSGGLIISFALGAAVGAGLAFLFGTKKGKEIREKVAEQYPEVFDKIHDVYENLVEEVKEVEEETVQEKVADLGKAVEDLGQKLESVSPSSHRFLKSGRKL